MPLSWERPRNSVNWFSLGNREILHRDYIPYSLLRTSKFWCRANLFGDVLPYVMASILHVKGYRVSYAHSGSPSQYAAYSCAYNRRILVLEATSSLRLYRDTGENATSIVSKKST